MQKTTLFDMVGHLVSMHRDKTIDDFDLYNSILRLIYASHEENKTELKKIVEWFDNEEKNNVDRKAQYSYKNVTENAGENYREGLMRIQPMSENTEQQ